MAAARIASGVTTKFSADLRRELFVRGQGFSAAEIVKFGTTSLITRNTTDVTTIQTFLTQLLGLGLLAPVTAFAGRVAVVIAVAVPVLIVAATAIIFGASRYPIRLLRKHDGTSCGS